MRAMWAAATGMKAMQTQIDTISNNLANANNTAFKKQRVEFKDLMYQKIGSNPTSTMQVGLGVMPSGTVRMFSQGNVVATENPTDLAIEGDGFFVVHDEGGQDMFTRDGTFKVSLVNGEKTLTTSDGYIVQTENGDLILGNDVIDINVGKLGEVNVLREGTTTYEYLGTIEMVSFNNPAGLEAIGSNLYKETNVSGGSIASVNGDAGTIRQGFLELSNVNVVEEMINLISAQRAYEINSKTIQTADEMMQTANNLKR